MTVVEDRFWAKVDRRGEDECWEWLAARTNDGYGGFNPGRGLSGLAHRYSYELNVGPIPAGLEIDHLCRNRGCVNPAHLEPVTSQINVLRGVNPAAQNARKTHCDHGHEFTPENTVYRRWGNRGPWRRCRECHLAETREAKRRRRAGVAA